MAGDTRDRELTVEGGGLRTWLAVYLKGLAMGAADSVPGVSGGTIAFVLGIYERLVTAIAELHPRVLGHLPRLHTADGRRALLSDLRAMDVPFLVVLGTGVATAVVTVSRVAHAALTTVPALTFAFFFGLIAASAAVFYDQLRLDTPGRIGAGIAGFVIAFLVSGVTTGGSIPNALPVIFVGGIVAISAMILPGVSGAFFLLLLGQYEYLSGQLKALVDRALALVVGDATLASVLEPAVVVAVFMTGATIGVLSVARVIRWALETYRYATLVFLVALMVGALRLPVEEVADNTAAWSVATVVPIVLAALVGGLAVLGLERYSSSMAY